MRRIRFHWKLYAGYAVLIVLTSVIGSMVILRGSVWDARQETLSMLQTATTLLRDIAASVLGSPAEAGLQQRLHLLETALGTRFTVVRADGTVVADSAAEPSRMDNHVDRPEIIAARLHGLGTATRMSYTLGTPLVYLALPVQPHGQLLGYVRTALPQTVLDARLARLRRNVLLGAGVAVGLGLLAGYLFVRRITQPLISVTTAAASIASENYAQPIWTRTRDEFGTLAEAVNRVGHSLRERMETLTREHNQLLTVLGSMVEGVVAVDRDECVVHMNKAAGTILHASSEASIGRPLWEVTRVRTIVETLSDTIREGEAMVREAHIVESPRELIIEMHAAPLRSSTGKTAGAVVVLHDVTELRRLEEVRREFVANVSHELKTPITAIKGFVETLRDGALDDRQQAERFLEIIARHAERLHAIIEDLLSLSRLEQGEEVAALPRTEAALIDVLQTAVQDCATKAATRQITILPVCDMALRARINTPLIEQALVNLLDNAINYSKAGSTVWLEAAQEGNEWVMRVRDEGIGIAQQHLPRLFERFYRVDKARSREHGGTGLGLAIVKHIALAHGGWVSVTSAVGKGSTFTIHLPMTAALVLHT